jgi:DNA-binding CsgD family transcriptional regulator
MFLFKAILLGVSYTIGIITLSVQLVCYFKEIEYRETLLLSSAFLLNILVIILNAFGLFQTSGEIDFYNLLLNICSVLLIFTIPLNIHKERVVKSEAIKNKILFILSSALLIFTIIGYILNLHELTVTVVGSFLMVSVIYSMYLSTATNPSLLIKHREKEERITARFFLVFVPLYIGFGMLNNHYEWLNISFFDGEIILPMIFCALAVSKLTDDVKRLSLGNEVNKSTLTEKLNHYSLTPREQEVVSLLIAGYSYKKIGEDLFISMPTVKTHVSNIYKKTKSKNKVELINLLSD